MKKAIIIASVALSVGSGAQAAEIAGLCNTGQAAANARCDSLSSLGAADANWTRAGGTAYVGTPLNGAWASNTSTSRWLTPAANGAASAPPGNYAFSLVFDLTGMNASTASFDGRFLVDNEVLGITLNGSAVTQGGAGGFGSSSWTTFASNGGFVSGANTLTFNIRNFTGSGVNPSGVRVEFLSSSVAAVPEPSAWALFILGFGLVGASMRRRTVKAAIAA